MPDRSLLRALAGSLASGDQDPEQIAARLAHTLDRDWRWLKPLATRYLRATSGKPRPRVRDAVDFLLRDRDFRKVLSRHKLFVEQPIVQQPHRMLPALAARSWPIPPIESTGALADWLGLTIGELEWFADLKNLSNPERLAHYRYRILEKQSGTVRIIEAPKPRLKTLQRKILHEILEKIPAHPAAHGFLKARSIRTFASPHTQQQVVLKMDLEDFFPTLSRARVQALFRTAGYPETVADLLGGICTNVTPNLNLSFEAKLLYARPHLPQGAPTSPVLANLCFYRADARLSGLAAAAGATYTRYADDLAISGDTAFARNVDRFSTHVAAILLEEGFRAHHRKTRIMRQGVRQYIAGLVTNERVNVVRADFDRLKAILTNCAKHGPVSQNREAHAEFRLHLEGRVGFVESVNPAKGRRLRKILETIVWEGPIS